MISDVPVGIFLSGGVDSGLVAYYASRKTSNLNSFSIGFHASLRYNESPFSQKVARIVGTNHHEIICTAALCKPYIAEIGKYVDDPVCDPAMLPTLILAHEARKKVKVVLSGEGADELFAGYPRYSRQLTIEKIRTHKKLFQLLVSAGSIFGRFENVKKPIIQRYHTQNIWDQLDIGKLIKTNLVVTSQIYYPELLDRNVLLAMQLSDVKGYLAEQLLMKVDKSTMANNLEARAPYLDTDLINLALGLPDKYKVNGLTGKYLLKKVAEKYLPKWVVWRPKHGFSIPLKQWFTNELKSEVRESVGNISKYAPAINIKYYQHIVDEHFNRRQDHADRIWSLMVMGNWLKYHGIVYG